MVIGIVLFLIVGILPVLFMMPSLAATLVSAPLLLLVPAGVGNAFAFGLRGCLPYRLSKLQAMLIAYFAGTLLIIVSFLLCERLLGSRADFIILSVSIYATSVVGWLRIGRAYHLDTEEKKFYAKVILICVPIVVLRYAYSISIYSDYPIIDLFQRSHFHGGAFEFALTKTLNPFAADSYIPFQQLFLGLQIRLTGADPLDAEWVWPLALAPLQIGAILCVVQRLLPDGKAHLVALVVALAQFGLSNPTNGAIAEMVTMLLLSVLWPLGNQVTSSRADVLPLLASVAAVLIGLSVTKLPIVAASLVIFAVIIIGNLASRRSVDRVWPAVAITTIALPFHRGALLFVALAVALSGCRWLLILARERFQKFELLVTVVILGILALLVAMSVKILAAGRELSDIFGLWQVFDLVLMPITGKSLANVAVDGDLAPGVGARVALFEVARAVSPVALAAVLSGILVNFRSLLCHRTFRTKSVLASRQRDGFSEITLLLFGMITLILTGFPFIHRASFLVTLFASAALAFLLCNAKINRTFGRYLLLCTISYTLALMAAPFLFGSDRVYPYLIRALPVLLVTACVGVLGIAISLVAAAWSRLPLILGVVVAIALEFAVSRSYFKSYAFQNQPVPESGPLSAYDLVDLAITRQVRSLSSNGDLVVSDPKTMTVLRSRTGLLPLVALSNLDTIAEGARENLKIVLSSALSDEPLKETCGKLRDIVNAGASGIYNYGHLRLSRPSADGASVLHTLGYKNRLVPVFDPRIGLAQRKEKFTSNEDLVLDDEEPLQALILVNRGTLDWLKHPELLRYFPVRGDLPGDLLLLLKNKYPQGALMKDTFVAKLEC